MNRNGIFNKKIPTLLGLLILVTGLVAGIILVNRRTGFESNAGPTESPKNVKITNLGANTFSVSWNTDTPMTGYLKYSEDPGKINLPAGDVRDQISGTSQSYTNHYVTVTGLTGNKTYYFVIGSGSQIYNTDGKPYQIRTWQQASLPTEDVASGKVVTADGGAVNGAVVYLDLEGGQTLSTITKSDGSWRINMATARDKDGKVLTYDPEKATITIFVQAGTQGTATAATTTAKARPSEDIVLGKNQSFVSEAELANDIGQSISETATRSATFEIASAESADTTTQNADGAKITYPAIEGELIATNSPEFLGQMTPGSTVILGLGELEEEVTVGPDGKWRWSPSGPLTPGKQELTLYYLDAQEKEKTLSRSFSIVTAGEIGGLPAFVATPSATASLTPTPTDITTMPETDDPELEEAGVPTAFILLLIGIGLYILGKRAEKWVK